MIEPTLRDEDIGKQRTYKGGRPQKYILNERGRRLILELYDGSTERIDLLVRDLGAPRAIIMKWASLLGMTTRRCDRKWSPEEIDYLESHLYRSSIDDIAKYLNRTKISVMRKAYRIGTNQYQEGYTMVGLARGLGCSTKTVKQWVEAGMLKGARRQTERKHDVWLFTDKDIRDFAKNHAHLLNRHKVDLVWLVDVLLGGLGQLGEKTRGEKQ